MTNKLGKDNFLKIDPRIRSLPIETPFLKFLKVLTKNTRKFYDQDVKYIEIKWLLIHIETSKDRQHDWVDDVRINQPEIEPDFIELDNILEICCENISILKYKKLLRELVSINVTYGNGVGIDYVATKSIVLEELFNWLTKENLIKDYEQIR